MKEPASPTWQMPSTVGPAPVSPTHWARWPTPRPQRWPRQPPARQPRSCSRPSTGGVTGNTIASTSTGGDNTFTAALFTGGGIATNDLLTSSDATAALTLINSAVATVAGARGNIGATVNRLQSASNVINNQVQNLTAAENNVTGGGYSDDRGQIDAVLDSGTDRRFRSGPGQPAAAACSETLQ